MRVISLLLIIVFSLYSFSSDYSVVIDPSINSDFNNAFESATVLGIKDGYYVVALKSCLATKKNSDDCWFQPLYHKTITDNEQKSSQMLFTFQHSTEDVPDIVNENSQVEPVSIVDIDKFSLITSLASSGDLSGGFRYGISDLSVIDFGVVFDSSSDESIGYFIDYYYGYFGVLISAEPDEAPTYSAMFAAEGALSDAVSIGIGFKIVEISTSGSPVYGSGWDSYLIIPF